MECLAVNSHYVRRGLSHTNNLVPEMIHIWSIQLSGHSVIWMDSNPKWVIGATVL